MPQIRDYEANTPLEGPQVNRRANEQDTGGLGLAIRDLGETVSKAGKQMAEREAQAETADLSAKLSKAHADMAAQLDDALMKADPSDRTIAQKFMDHYDNTMSSLGNEIQTPEAQRYFERSNAEMRSQFQIQAIRHQSSMAGHGAVISYNASLQNWSALLNRDPSAMDATLTSHREMIDSLAIDQNAKAKLLAEGESKLAKSQFDGMLEIDPASAQKLLAKGRWDSYFNSTQLMELEKEAQTYVRAQDAEAARIQKKKDDAATELAEATKNQFLAKLYSNDGLSTKEVLRSTALDEVSKEHFLSMIEKSNSAEKIKTDPSTMIDLFQRIHAPEGDPQRIADPDTLLPYFGKGLDISSLQQLRAEIAGKRTPQGEIDSQLKKNFLETIRGKLTKTNPLFGLRDPDGDAQYQAFLSRFLPAYDTAIRGGQKAEVLLNPASDQYMGKMLTPYLRTPEQIIQAMLPKPNATPTPTPTPTTTPPEMGEVRRGYKFEPANPKAWEKVVEPRKPGETPADYLKRTQEQTRRTVVSPTGERKTLPESQLKSFLADPNYKGWKADPLAGGK